jgi:hypothetical protein
VIYGENGYVPASGIRTKLCAKNSGIHASVARDFGGDFSSDTKAVVHICPHPFSTDAHHTLAQRASALSALSTKFHNRYPQQRQRLMENLPIAL